jgi:hypothetical protein
VSQSDDLDATLLQLPGQDASTPGQDHNVVTRFLERGSEIPDVYLSPAQVVRSGNRICDAHYQSAIISSTA